MTNTVTRLMALADKAISAQDQRLGHLAQNYRQALEAELTRLLTPLSDEHLFKRWQVTTVLDNLEVELDWADYRILYLHFATMHGIGGES